MSSEVMTKGSSDDQFYFRFLHIIILDHKKTSTFSVTCRYSNISFGHYMQMCKSKQINHVISQYMIMYQIIVEEMSSISNMLLFRSSHIVIYACVYVI